MPVGTRGGSRGLTAVGSATGRLAHVALVVTAATPTTALTATPTVPPTATTTPVGPMVAGGLYHLSGSLVDGGGGQLRHVEGILTLRVAATGSLAGSTLRLATGVTVAVSGSGGPGSLSLSLAVGDTPLTGQSSVVSANRISGLFSGPAGGPVGFWVTTRVVGQQGTRYTFGARVTSGPNAGLSYDGPLELFADAYGGLLGYLTLPDGRLLRVDGQSVNGVVNMLVVVRPGTPLFALGTTMIGGALRGTIAGPLAGDLGSWTATL